MSGILIPLDLCHHSDEITMKGFNLAKKLDLPITLLFVIDDHRVAILKRHQKKFEDEIVEQLKNEATIFMERQQKRALEMNLTVDIIIERGSPASKILEVANRIKQDIIVMGARGDSVDLGLNNKKYLGSISHSVIKSADIPVHIIPFKHN
ncbi:MAG: universal stress protein [Candidatus Hodarchaeota archaeon]